MRNSDVEKALASRLPDGCLSNFAIDRAADGEADAIARAHTASCASCAERVAAARSATASFPDTFWVAGAAERARVSAGARAQAPLVRERSRAAFFSRAAGVAAIAACLLLIVAPRPKDDSAERSKGGAALDAIVKQADGRIRRVVPGETLAAGDALRFEITAPRGGFAAVVGLDERPSVTAYAAPVSLTPGRTILEGSTVLDATPGVERDVAVVCESPVPIDEIVRAAQASLDRAHGDPANAGALGIPGCREASFVFSRARP